MGELAAFVQRPRLNPAGLRRKAVLPYGLKFDEVRRAMQEVYDFLHFVNNALVNNGLDRLEDTVLGNSFIGIVSELCVRGISRHGRALVRNRKVGGHPDLIQRGRYPGDSVLKADEGIEVKASVQPGGWQGHNPEKVWVMIFQYRVDTTREPRENRAPLVFLKVMVAELEEPDWSFSGRRGASRRTPTASILKTGTQKLHANPIYEDPNYRLVRPRPLRRQGSYLGREP